MHRNGELRKDKTSFGIVDAQSVQNADTAEYKGYDAGKKTSGIKKRHIVVDSQGLPHAILVTTANITDRKGAIKMITLNLNNLSDVEKLLVDGGYLGKPFAEAVAQLCGAEVEVIKHDELHKFVVLPMRCVVERTFGWLDKSRRLWKNCERSLHSSLQMTILALISVLILEGFEYIYPHVTSTLEIGKYYVKWALRDIKSRLVKRVVVYKLDRISRSIFDFAGLMAIFQEYKVESITLCM